MVHADNPHTAKASVDFLEANGMRKSQHSAYSLNLAPSDFLLFGHVKRLMQGQSFGSSVFPALKKRL
jgi:hypothetical protein